MRATELLEITNSELDLIIENTSKKLYMSKAIIEKDFWVCMALKYLFNEFKYKDFLAFKGGTSLSKVYKLIERFSEDIDLALNWELLGYGKNEPYIERSNSKQVKFNEKINCDTKIFIREKFLPIINEDFKNILKDRNFRFYIDENDKQTICFDYPKNTIDNSIMQIIRLEIGTLAEPIPASKRYINTYIEDAYPNLFNEKISVVVVDSLRTFYEKITILHREANRINNNYPNRYSRHFYDVFKMINTNLREESLKNLNLLKNVIDFKKKFYSCNWANYDDIMMGKLKLIPSSSAINIFAKDYEKMKSMLFGNKISFETIIVEIKKYESQINEQIRKMVK